MKQVIQGWSKRMTALVAAIFMTVTAFVVGPVAIAPSMSAQGVDIPGVSAEAYQGWGTKCGTTRIRTGTSGSWAIYTTTTYRYFTSSLGGTTCLKYSSTKDYVRIW